VSELKNINGIIWDLDNTLYRFDEAFVHVCNRAVVKTMLAAGLQKTEEEAFDMAVKSYYACGNSFRVFMDMGFDYKKLHHEYHDRVEFDSIFVIEKLCETMESLPQKMVVLTNASRPWAQKILIKTKLNSVFGDHNVVCLEDVSFKAKSQGTDGFLLAIERGGMSKTPNEEILVVEDIAHNLVHAKNMRMVTALVHGPATNDAHIDHHFDEVMDLCKILKS